MRCCHEGTIAHNSMTVGWIDSSDQVDTDTRHRGLMRADATAVAPEATAAAAGRPHMATKAGSSGSESTMLRLMAIHTMIATTTNRNGIAVADLLPACERPTIKRTQPSSAMSRMARVNAAIRAPYPLV